MHKQLIQKFLYEKVIPQYIEYINSKFHLKKKQKN